MSRKVCTTAGTSINGARSVNTHDKFGVRHPDEGPATCGARDGGRVLRAATGDVTGGYGSTQAAPVSNQVTNKKLRLNGSASPKLTDAQGAALQASGSRTY